MVGTLDVGDSWMGLDWTLIRDCILARSLWRVLIPFVVLELSIDAVQEFQDADTNTCFILCPVVTCSVCMW